MKNEKDLSVYEMPEIRVVKLGVEQPILISSNPTIINPDMGWDD